MTDVQTFVPYVSDRTEHRIEIALGQDRTSVFTGDDLDRPVWVVCLNDGSPSGPTWRTVGAPARSKSSASATVQKIENGAYKWGKNAPAKVLGITVIAVPGFDF